MKSEYISCAAAALSVLSVGYIWQDYSNAIRPKSVRTMQLMIVGGWDDKVAINAGQGAYGGSLLIRDDTGRARLEFSLNEKREPILRFRKPDGKSYETITVRELVDAARRK